MPHIHEKIDFDSDVFIVHDNKVLLRKHDKYKMWLAVGGHIELDEDPNQAAVLSTINKVFISGVSDVVYQYYTHNLAMLIGEVGLYMLSKTSFTEKIERIWLFMKLGSKYGGLALSDCNWKRLLEDQSDDRVHQMDRKRRIDSVLYDISIQATPELSACEVECVRRCCLAFATLDGDSKNCLKKIAERPHLPDDLFQELQKILTDPWNIQHKLTMNEIAEIYALQRS